MIGFFAFPGEVGYCIQYFDNIRLEKPPASIWELPNECQGDNVPVCSSPAPPLKLVNPHNGSS